jgi:hypothetical protein
MMKKVTAVTTANTEMKFTKRFTSASIQGLTLVHFPAQLERILWERGAFRGYLRDAQEVSGGIQEYQGVFRVYFVSETAQVKLRSGRG